MIRELQKLDLKRGHILVYKNPGHLGPRDLIQAATEAFAPNAPPNIPILILHGDQSIETLDDEALARVGLVRRNKVISEFEQAVSES